ncbi:MAG: thiamine pyrophosphate-dependent dehydrogenase E1 component subunit alpha [Firmicutes bacterium]|nr:thiamine pyrophosphate-dependent dehydrogenase E1 component subunit alpha [Bacillota bacterium]
MNNVYYLSPPQFHVDRVEAGELKALLLSMMRIREFEERIADLVTEKKIITPCHLYTGQEAVATGICHALEREDYLFGSHRSHGHYIAKGGNLQEAMAEIFGRATGCSKGRGGSMHLVAPEVGILGTSSIVAGSMAIAVGTALAESIRGTGRVTAIFHGDGVPEEGIWHESANFAGLKRLPIIFVCENNLYCTHMSLDKRRVYDNLPEVAKAHGLTPQLVDGNNVLDVYYAARDAVKRAREGGGPTFIECRTYRWRGHVGPNFDVDLGLRSQDELDAWRDRCPIKHFAAFLFSTGVLSEEDIGYMWKDVRSEISQAIINAQSSPYPDPADLTRHVFKGDDL